MWRALGRKRCLVAAVLLLAALLPAHGFAPVPLRPNSLKGVDLGTSTTTARSKDKLALSNPSLSRLASSSTTTNLSMMPAVISAVVRYRPLVRMSLIAMAALTLLVNAKRILWPNTSPDRAYSEPLPAGSLGCPLFGSPFFWGSKEYGAGGFYLRASKKLEDNARRLWKYYFMSRPFVVVAGTKQVKQVLQSEFDPQGVAAFGRNSSVVTGSESLVTEKSRDRHSFLRRLVGQSMSPSAIAQSVPSLQKASEIQADRLLAGMSSSPVKMETICTDFTLDVAWRQILGLNLSEEEVPRFVEAVDDWIGMITSVRALFNIGVKGSKGYKAKQYLEGLIEEKIDALEANGPDSSTLSGMVFATDDEVDDASASARKLTRQQVIDNAMLLILAGSETSASTLTNAMLFMGLNRDVWMKLVQEQRALEAKYGSELTKEQLDQEAPYLEAVVKESMRLKPVSGGIPRVAKETMIVDGKQIPKNWIIDWNIVLTHQLDPKTYKEDGSHMDVIKGFVPERWLSDETRPVDFLPMGAGPRYCLGANLAFVEMKVFLAVLARKIDYALAGAAGEGKVVWKPMSIIPKEREGVLVKVRAPQKDVAPVSSL